MNSKEIEAVAQAITDAHANKPGNDCSGRLDDAKTMIAAFDAISKFRTTREKAPAATDSNTPTVVVSEKKAKKA